MRHWHVRMTFEGDVEADTAVAAAKAFKASLGLAPESNRPDAVMTALEVRDHDSDRTVLTGRNLRDDDMEIPDVQLPPPRL